MEKEKIMDLVLNVATEDDGVKKLACPKAFSMAKEHDIKLMDIKTACDEAGVRLCDCQLGCF